MTLFLDFDGVLHPKGADPGDYFCHLSRLEAVLRHWPDVRIVISSTWQDAYSLPALRRRFSPDIAERIIGGTREADPDGEAEDRHDEIRAYLRHVGALASPWVALDDAGDEFPESCENLVLCASAVGLDDDAADRLRAALRGL
jgi:hypothetical protein